MLAWLLVPIERFVYWYAWLILQPIERFVCWFVWHILQPVSVFLVIILSKLLVLLFLFFFFRHAFRWSNNMLVVNPVKAMWFITFSTKHPICKTSFRLIRSLMNLKPKALQVCLTEFCDNSQLLFICIAFPSNRN